MSYPLIEVRDDECDVWSPLPMTIYEYCNNITIEPDNVVLTEYGEERFVTMTWLSVDVVSHIRYQHDAKGRFVYNA